MQKLFIAVSEPCIDLKTPRYVRLLEEGTQHPATTQLPVEWKMNGIVGAGKDDKGRELTIYWEFIPSHCTFWEKGLDRTKANKVKVKEPPLQTYLPTHYLPNILAPPGALTKIQGEVGPGLT